MNLEQAELLHCIGTNQDVSLPPIEGNLFIARLLSVDAVSNILQSSPETTTALFSPEEILYSLRYKVRPHEHFAVRLGAKQIVLGLLGNDTSKWQDFYIASNEFKSPSFVFDNSAQESLNQQGIEAVHVSLAHGNNIAVAFCAVEKTGSGASTKIVRIGTDICPATPFQSSLERKTTFTKKEVEAAERQDSPSHRYAMYFAAKESVIKILEKFAGWIWQEIEIDEEAVGQFAITLTGSAKEELEEIGASKIITSLSYKESVGALAFSAAFTSIDRLNL